MWGQRIGVKHVIRVIYCFIFLCRPWPSHVTPLLLYSFLPLLLWIFLVSPSSVSSYPVVATAATTFATFFHDLPFLADTLCDNPSFANSRYILKGLVLCFHACPIVLMGIIAVHIINLMSLWAWAVLPIMVYIIST